MKTTLMIVVLTLATVSGCTGAAKLAYPPNSNAIGAAKAAGAPIALSGVHGERDSANGINVGITWKNISPDKTVKHCWFDAEFSNSVGEIVSSEIGDKNSITLKDTGPYKPGKTVWGGLSAWPRAFYHPNASTIRLTFVRCEYMDGFKTEKVSLRSLPTAIGKVE